jgi:hypothetical protein
MKNIIIGTTCLMMVGLLIATFLFEKSSEINKLGRNLAIKESDIQELKPRQPNPLQPIYVDDSIGYTLQNDQLQITFNKGKDWRIVPVEKDKLFEGEHNGNKQELIENSYILSKSRASFLYSHGKSPDGKSIRLIYSLDQGKTWEETIVTEHYPQSVSVKLNL